MKNKNLLIIGGIPPPIGGVSIHVKRLLNYLKSADLNKILIFYDYKKESYINGLKRIREADIIHLHLSNKRIRFLMVLLGKLLRKNIIITFHGKYDFRNFFDRWALQHAGLNLVLNAFTFSKANAVVREGAKIKLVSAFIPPIEDEEELSKKTKEQIDVFQDKFKKVICTNAHHFVLDINGKDLYGIDFILECMNDLSEIGLIIADPSGELYKRYEEYSKFRNVLFITQPEPFVEIIKMSDIFVRATTTDGDSLSVKESLYYKTPVLASDCIDRPESCMVYPLYDQRDFKMQLLQTAPLKGGKIKNGALQIIQLYNTL